MGNKNSFFESRLIEANSKENRLQMFATSNKDTNKAIQDTKELMCVVYHFNVKVQFMVEKAKLGSIQKNSVLISQLPSKVYKLQCKKARKKSSS